MDANVEVIETAAASGSIEELLVDLDMSDIVSEADNADAILETLSEGDVAAIEVAGAVSEAYADAKTSSTDVSAPVTEKPARKPREKKAATEKAPKDLASLAPEVFVIADGVTDLEANKTSVIGMMPTQKKIAEKFENLFRSISVSKAPSVFITTCFDVLSKAGTATSTEFVAALKAADYGEGTARSQAGQIMALFALVGVATREGQKLTFHADAPISKKLAAIPAK